MVSGMYGVQLFFIASALTLMLSQKRHRVESRPWLKFMLRRFFRIAPLYYLATLFYFAYFTALHKGVPFLAVPANLLFIHGLIPPLINIVPPGGWSVGAEMLFYLAFFPLFKVGKSLGGSLAFVGAGSLLALVSAFALAQMGHSLHDDSGFAYFGIQNQLVIFACGFVTFHAIERLNAKGGNGKIGLVLTLLGIALGLTAGALRVESVFYHLAVAPALALFAVGLSQWQPTSLVNEWICRIGTLSFSVYLGHFIALDIARLFLMKALRVNSLSGFPLTFLLFALTVLLAFGIASFLYKFVEQKGIDLGRGVIARLDRAPSSNPQ
jgi:peptidoglycan/LPS O-acetylase OafA/YrhL